VGRFVADHPIAGELLTAVGAVHIASGVVLNNFVEKALNEPTRAALVIFVKQRIALCAVN